MTATNLSLSACHTACKLMKQMLKKALTFIQPDVSLVVNIKESADAMTAAVKATGSPVSDFNKGNIKARGRMIAQYALAGAHSGRSLNRPCCGKYHRLFLPSLVTVVRIFSLFTASINVKGNNSWRNLVQTQPFMKKIPTARFGRRKPGLADEVALESPTMKLMIT